MSIEFKPRGAWPVSGLGGTLKKSKGKVVPGPYYMTHPTDLNQWPGIRAFLHKMNGSIPDYNDDAVYHGVLAIQALLNYNKIPIHLNGVFDSETSNAVISFQKSVDPKTADGIVGKATMRRLLLPLIKEVAKTNNEDWRPIYGILENEGGWDPGAIGALDKNDRGLAQINAIAHPDVSFSDAMCPSFTVNWVAKYLRRNLDALNGNERDSIAAYNLGLGGTRQWIAAGRPNQWVPPWDTSKRVRDVKLYIDRILAASNGIS